MLGIDVSNHQGNINWSAVKQSGIEVAYIKATEGDYFKDKYPKDEIYFVCGADNLDYIDSWQKSTYILKNYKILVVNRENYDLKNILNKYKEYKENIIVCDIPLNKISSTGIREKIKRGERIKDLVRPTVEKYIKDNNLYQD